MSVQNEILPDVSRETLSRLEIYADLLVRWNRRINLVSSSTITNLWIRHIIDSAQLARLAPATARRWVDLGSGAGLPGLVVAAIRLETAPLERMVLIDSDTRKSAFMAEAARAMGVQVEIETWRIGDSIGKRPFDVISARALAPLPKLLDYAQPFLSETTTCLFPKGKNRTSEIQAASLDWQMKIEEVENSADCTGVILRIREISRKTAVDDN